MRTLKVFLGLAPIIARARLQTWLLRRRGPTNTGDPRRVLFLASFWPGNAGYEYRVARWADALRAAGYEVDIDCVFGHEEFWGWVERNDWRLYVTPARRRLRRILDSQGYGTVIVVREILLWNDYGDLFLERLLLAMHPDAVLDIDDDLGAAKGEPKTIGRFGRLLGEQPAKFSSGLQMYRRVIAGSAYLRHLVLERGQNIRPEDVIVIPTCLDYELESPKVYHADHGDRGPTVIGWIGGTGNLGQLDLVAPALQRLAAEVPLRLLVISGRPYFLDGVDVENVQWDMDTHTEQLRRVDIGIMPLRDTLAARGKCGFKLLQYMGLGIVAMATAITVNAEIVQDGVDGFLVAPDADWEVAFRRVLARRDSFERIGNAARRTVFARYSFQAHHDTYVDFVGTRADRTPSAAPTLVS
jgi:glycosyltransferase involved in cell wall biosynthesis